MRVAIVDDEALVRSGLQLVLNAAPDIEVVATSDGLSAVDAIRASNPDVVLLDVRMPGRDGIAVLRELRQWQHPPVVAILTTFDSDEFVAQALHLGASGFLVKDTDPEQLPALVRSLAAGGVVLSPQVSASLLAHLRVGASASTSPGIDQLTPRERDVLTELHQGASNTEIGVRMHLSVATVKDHVSSILSKLGVDSRLQAALIVERQRTPPEGESP